MTNDEIAEVRDFYEASREQSLVDRITSEVGAEYETFVLKVLVGERDESGEVDEDAAAAAAGELYEAGKGNFWGTYHPLFPTHSSRPIPFPSLPPTTHTLTHLT